MLVTLYSLSLGGYISFIILQSDSSLHTWSMVFAFSVGYIGSFHVIGLVAAIPWSGLGGLQTAGRPGRQFDFVLVESFEGHGVPGTNTKYGPSKRTH
jgi:hypothetical protein